mmetsp:Transcript_9754/g.27404  ORF Transcript_9754/g.27404 Transcript_9754/m.27404 type:complete len:214 (-) Transcript_9754:871-1512(-)
MTPGSRTARRRRPAPPRGSASAACRAPRRRAPSPRRRAGSTAPCTSPRRSAAGGEPEARGRPGRACRWRWPSSPEGSARSPATGSAGAPSSPPAVRTRPPAPPGRGGSSAPRRPSTRCWQPRRRCGRRRGGPPSRWTGAPAGPTSPLWPGPAACSGGSTWPAPRAWRTRSGAPRHSRRGPSAAQSRTPAGGRGAAPLVCPPPRPRRSSCPARR